MDKTKAYAKKGGEMAGKGMAMVSKKVGKLNLVDKAKAAKNAAYDKMGLSQSDRQDVDNLGKAVGVLGAAAATVSVAASMAPALIVGGAVAAGGYVVAKEKAPDRLEAAKDKAKKVANAAEEVGKEFMDGAKEGKAKEKASTPAPS